LTSRRSRPPVGRSQIKHGVTGLTSTRAHSYPDCASGIQENPRRELEQWQVRDVQTRPPSMNGACASSFRAPSLNQSKFLEVPEWRRFKLQASP
jgi:hypothetical protein